MLEAIGEGVFSVAGVWYAEGTGLRPLVLKEAEEVSTEELAWGLCEQTDSATQATGGEEGKQRKKRTLAGRLGGGVEARVSQLRRRRTFGRGRLVLVQDIGESRIGRPLLSLGFHCGRVGTRSRRVLRRSKSRRTDDVSVKDWSSHGQV
jgi:hypothetical protein